MIPASDSVDRCVCDNAVYTLRYGSPVAWLGDTPSSIAAISLASVRTGSSRSSKLERILMTWQRREALREWYTSAMSLRESSLGMFLPMHSITWTGSTVDYSVC